MGGPEFMVAAMIGGGLLKAKGGYDAANAEIDINNNNALLMRRAAVDAVARGSYEAGLARTEGTATIAAGTTVTAASGFDVADQTALDVAATTRGTAALNAEMIRNNALRESLGFQAQAHEAEYRSKLAKRSRNFGVVSDLLGTGAQAYSMAAFPKVGAGGKT